MARGADKNKDDDKKSSGKGTDTPVSAKDAVKNKNKANVTRDPGPSANRHLDQATRESKKNTM